ncbi:hypothetical protein KFK09_010246 [Dendrobium nobile]|uniref:Uncharacterized protein n=1 Tax=Dendrobium nobile TaxID=94219 RepID=A0A8T3BLP3_DENNO|nr:hypothetical protein KFK09_010246 [Dendrobium nobile]
MPHVNFCFVGIPAISVLLTVNAPALLLIMTVCAFPIGPTATGRNRHSTGPSGLKFLEYFCWEVDYGEWRFLKLLVSFLLRRSIRSLDVCSFLVI